MVSRQLTSIAFSNYLTLQAVESREKVQQNYSSRSPGKEANGPSKPKQQGETGNSLEVMHQSTAGPRGAVDSHVANLYQNHDKNLRGDAKEGVV